MVDDFILRATLQRDPINSAGALVYATSPEAGQYLIEVRKLGPKYTYYLRLNGIANPYSPSTGFFDNEQDALQAALAKAAQLLEKYA
jgi:hypothetical protein